MLDKFLNSYGIKVETDDNYYNEHFKNKDNLTVEFMKKRLRNKGSGSGRQNPTSYMVNNIVYFLLITAAPPRTAVTASKINIGLPVAGI